MAKKDQIQALRDKYKSTGNLAFKLEADALASGGRTRQVERSREQARRFVQAPARDLGANTQVRSNESVYDIAERVYGNPAFFGLILDANPGVSQFNRGMTLKIPSLALAGSGSAQRDAVVEETQTLTGGGVQSPFDVQATQSLAGAQTEQNINLGGAGTQLGGFQPAPGAIPGPGSPSATPRFDVQATQSLAGVDSFMEEQRGGTVGSLTDRVLSGIDTFFDNIASGVQSIGSEPSGQPFGIVGDALRSNFPAQPPNVSGQGGVRTAGGGASQTQDEGQFEPPLSENDPVFAEFVSLQLNAINNNQAPAAVSLELARSLGLESNSDFRSRYYFNGEEWVNVNSTTTVDSGAGAASGSELASNFTHFRRRPGANRNRSFNVRSANVAGGRNLIGGRNFSGTSFGNVGSSIINWRTGFG